MYVLFLLFSCPFPHPLSAFKRALPLFCVNTDDVHCVAVKMFGPKVKSSGSCACLYLAMQNLQVFMVSFSN